MFKKIFVIYFIVISFSLMEISFAATALSDNQINANFARLTEPLTANESVFRDSLVGIIHQLQTIKPLITQAEQAQPPHARVFFHFEPWRDNNGRMHEGLRNDINAIQAALIQALNTEHIEPRTIAPLQADFVDNNFVKNAP